jgi:glycosyltransferase involved in cell wall biosynthesis
MRFTVLTATFNRVATLPGVFDSLRAQTFRDFEWIIVDDGSTDGTRELVGSWASCFPIRYLWKPRGGKHSALNLGIRQAQGEFIFIVDSDDRCLPHTLARWDFHWKGIGDTGRFACLGGLCYQADGATLVGRPLASAYVDAFGLANALDLLDGDRCGVVRTAVLREFPFPVFRHERFLPEGVVWNRLFRRYGARYVNEALLIAGYTPNGLSLSGDLRFGSPKGAVVYYGELALSDLPALVRLRAARTTLIFAVVACVRELFLRLPSLGRFLPRHVSDRLGISTESPPGKNGTHAL